MKYGGVWDKKLNHDLRQDDILAVHDVAVTVIPC